LPSNSTGYASRLAVAEAINVISLDALFGIIRLNVILRGDAVPLTVEERSSNVLPLSELAVRAWFDPPRIVFGRRGRINLNIGPRSSVVLDATYRDDKIRIGMGGTSGTKFVFRQCLESEMESANEFRALLARKPIHKFKAILALTAWTAGSVFVAACKPRQLLRTVGGSVSAIFALLGLALVVSSGGIERNNGRG
jgi:hypothetical protein